MRLEWRNTERGQLVLYADQHPSGVVVEFKPNEFGEDQKPFALRCGHRTEAFAALEDAKSKGMTW